MKHRGVTKRTTHAGTVRYQATVYHKGKPINAGSFGTQKEAARAYDAKARELHGDKAILNLDGRVLTVQEEQIYRLYHPDFYGLPAWAVAMLMHVHEDTVYRIIKRVFKKCPSLSYDSHANECNQYSYENWMDEYIKQKF
jgi:hypothetical protein